MSWAYEYAWRNLFQALKEMAASPANLQERLDVAAKVHLYKIEATHLPADLAAGWIVLKARLLGSNTQAPDGAVRTSASRMTDDEAREAAGAIARLLNAVALERHPNPQEGPRE